MADAYEQARSRMLGWHWSQQEPSSYYDVEKGGIGYFATIHPGAFNLAWLCLGSPTAGDYWKQKADGSLRVEAMSWVPTVTHQGLIVHETGPMRGITKWDVLTSASRQTLNEFAYELSERRNTAIRDYIGVDLLKLALDQLRKH